MLGSHSLSLALFPPFELGSNVVHASLKVPCPSNPPASASSVLELQAWTIMA